VQEYNPIIFILKSQCFSYDILKNMETVTRICNRTIQISFALLFILVPLILTPLNYELFEYNKMMLTYGLTVIITAAWIGTMIAKKRIEITNTRLDFPIALFFISQLISALFSMDPHVSWFGYYSRFNGGMFSVISYILLYYAFVSTVEKKYIVRYLTIILTTASIVAIYGILEHFGIDKNLWVQDVQARIFSTLGQPNWLSAYIVALLPLTMAFGIIKSDAKEVHIVKNRKDLFQTLSPSVIFFIVLTSIYFLTLLWTRSRSGLLAFVLADICFITAVGIKKQWFHKFSWPRIMPILIPHIIFFLIIISNGIYIEQVDAWITLKGWQQRIIRIVQPNSTSLNTKIANEATASGTTAETKPTGPALETGGTESGVIRLYVWQGAINAWKSSPKTILIGTGTETFAFAFYQFKPVGHNLTSEWDFLYNKAHNEFLNYLATTGLFGLGAYLFLIGSFIYWFFSNTIRSTKFEARNNIQIQNEKNISDFDIRISDLLSFALFSGWLSILVTNFFGFSVVIIQILFFLFPACCFVLRKKDTAPAYIIPLPFKHNMQIVTLSSTIGVMFIFLFLLVGLWVGDTLFASGYHLVRAGYTSDAYKKFTRALFFNNSEPLYHDELGTTLASFSLAAWENNEATLSSDLAKQSINENAIALSISPNNVNYWKSRTKILYTLSPINATYLDGAIEALEKARTLSPLDPKILYNLAILYGRAGFIDKGIDVLLQAKAMKRGYRDAYYGLVVFYKEKGQTDLMLTTAKEYLELFPNDQEFLDMIQ